MLTNIFRKAPVLSLLIICLLLLLPHLGFIQTNIMEARNLITAREMVSNHDYIFTTINGLPRYEKPPLPTWLTAFSGIIFGFKNMFFLRLPAALITCLLVYYFYKFLRLMLQQQLPAFNASLILVTSFYVFFSGRDNQWDIYTHAFMMAGIYYLCLLFSTQQHAAKNILLSGLFIGFSILSKGPVSLYALFIPFVMAYLLIYKANSRRNTGYLVIALIIGIIIGLSWPAYVRYFHPEDVHAALDQETTRWGVYNQRPFWYYWSFFTQSGIWTMPAFISLLYPYMKSRVSNLKAYRFSVLWTLISVLLLSAIPEKKARYLLPVLIPLAMNTGFYVSYLWKEFKALKNKKELFGAYASFGLIGVIAVAMPVILLIILKGFAAQYLFWQIAASVFSFTCGFIIIRGLRKKQFERVFYGTIFFMISIVIFIIPISAFYYSNHQYYAAEGIRQKEKELGIKTYEANGFTPEIIWDYGRPIPTINKGNELMIPADSSFGLLVFPEEENAFISRMNGCSFKKIGKVDVNSNAPGSKGYNGRLVKDYYLVTKLPLK
jgi:4-amino-4-deoxy-L-arabinose transferase-like glycosyltransferase